MIKNQANVSLAYFTMDKKCINCGHLLYRIRTGVISRYT